MLKKYAFLAALVSVGVFGVLAGAATMAEMAPAVSPTGLPLAGPILKPTPLPILTRDRLLTRGHAEDKLEIAELLYAYQFFHDTHNGEAIASLFTPGGAFEHLYNNGGKTIDPFPGPIGRGCMKVAPQDILKMYGTPIPLPVGSHNQVTNVIVQVNGDTGTVYANVVTTVSNARGKAAVAVLPNTAIIDHSSENIADVRKTPEGWRFVHLRVIQDYKPEAADAHPPCAATN